MFKKQISDINEVFLKSCFGVFIEAINNVQLINNFFFNLILKEANKRPKFYTKIKSAIVNCDEIIK